MDTTAPTVLATSPADHAGAVAANAMVTVTFSEPIDVATMTATSFTLSAGAAAIPGNVSASGNMATFTPTAPLNAGTVYIVSVSTAVKDLAGNALTGAASFSFSTAPAARSWSAPVRLDSADGVSVTPAIAATADPLPGPAAQATAVWVQHDGVQASVYANRYRDGNWEGAALVEEQTAVGNATAGGVSNPQVAMGIKGRTVMTWTYDDGNANYSIWGNVYDPIPPPLLQPPFASSLARRISTTDTASDARPAFDGSGLAAFVLWSQYDPGRPPAAFRIAQRQYLFVSCTPPCLWQEESFGWRPTTLVEIGPYDAIAPQVAGFGIGAAAAVWPQSNGQFGVISMWGSSYNPGSGWADAWQLNPGSKVIASSPVVAASPDGTATALWLETVGTRRTLLASRSNPAGWSAPLAIDASAGGQADAPQVVVDNHGNALLAWVQTAGGVRSVLTRRCPAGSLSACGAIVDLGASTDNAESLRMAGAPGGDAVAVWTLFNGAGQRRIVASRFNAAASAWDATPALIDSNASGAQVAIDASGHATAVWSKVSAGKTHIYASRSD